MWRNKESKICDDNAVSINAQTFIDCLGSWNNFAHSIEHRSHDEHSIIFGPFFNALNRIYMI